MSRRTEHWAAESDEMAVIRSHGTILPGQDKIYPKLRSALYPYANFLFGRYDGPANSPKEHLENFQENGR